MQLNWILASLHLIALALGFSTCWLRANALKTAEHSKDLKAVFRYDNLYGIATLIWIGTGLWRLFGNTDKESDYYLNNQAFLLKMGLFVIVFLLELKPMITLIRWRIELKRGQEPDMASTKQLATLTYAELGGFILMVMAATAMARGMG